MLSNPWLLCRQPNPHARLRLFCFPYAGGGVAIYRAWPEYFAPGIEVNAIQLPGRDERIKENPIGKLNTLVEALASALEPSLDKPYAFFGHSLGGLIAYEVVRRLRALGMPAPVHLFVSARRAPHIISAEAPIHALPESEFVSQLVRRYNGIPPAVLREPELMALFLPTLRADFKLMETYQWSGDDWFDRPITAFGAIDDSLVSPDDIRAWKDLTSGAFKAHMMAGGHFFLQQSQHQLHRLIAQELSSYE